MPRKKRRRRARPAAVDEAAVINRRIDEDLRKVMEQPLAHLVRDGDVVVVWRGPEERRGDGKLANPPTLAVVTVSDETYAVSIEPISFATLGALNSDRLHEVSELLRKERS